MEKHLDGKFWIDLEAGNGEDSHQEDNDIDLLIILDRDCLTDCALEPSKNGEELHVV